MWQQPTYVLVTGATGFIGAHVVDQLLSRGIKVRGATRSLAKGEAMIRARPQYAGQLDFVQIADFDAIAADGSKQSTMFDEAVRGVDGIIHTASPLTYTTTNNETELILPAIAGVRAILLAAASQSPPSVRRIVLTSSFASVMDASRTAPPYFTYTSADWNPLTYAEAAAPTTSAVIAYRGSKKFAELAAWEFMKEGEGKLAFDLATLCPPMTFGPVVHPVSSVDKLNESNAMLWRVASGETPLPVARVPFWVDVRDVAQAHVEALVREGAGGRRFLPAAPERISYGIAAGIVKGGVEWARERVAVEEQVVDESHGVDGEEAARELGLRYRSFRETVLELVGQAAGMEGAGV